MEHRKEPAAKPGVGPIKEVPGIDNPGSTFLELAGFQDPPPMKAMLDGSS